MPKIRNAELLFVLDHLKTIKLKPNVLHKGHVIQDSNSINQQVITTYLLSGPNAHLYALYIPLINILSVLAGIEWASLASQDGSPALNDEAIMVDAIKGCLSVIGEIFQSMNSPLVDHE